MSIHNDQLRELGDQLGAIDPDANPQKARALSKRKKQLKHQSKLAKGRSRFFQVWQENRKKGGLPT